MEQHVEHKMRVNIPAKQIWEVLGDFSSIERFAMTVKKSPILAGKHSGLGAKRKCEFYDGKSVVEEIIDYEDGKGFKLVLTEHPMPLKTFYAEMKVIEIDANSSEIMMSMDFVAKGGPFGWLMGYFMMRPMMKGIIEKILTGLAYHSATGRVVRNELPSQDTLTLALSN